MSIPYLSHDGNSVKLYIHDKPFLMLGGEVHNSSPSSASHMETEVWPHVARLNLNTLLVPVSWELIEPEEGAFDFSLVQSVIEQARERGVALVLLWFGLWKNGMSTYAPAWVKQSPSFFRVRDSYGAPVNAISPFCAGAVEKDAAAFARLMGFLKAFDGDENTVAMVQVENEIGVFGSDRDYSEQAEEAFRKELPAEISRLFPHKESWEDFGGDAPEIFMASAFARAVQQIARAGASAYPIPFYVNAWLEQFPGRPGQYPSGGPIAKVMAVWQKSAPAIAVFAPDIYLKDFEAVCREYTQNQNPLFIPEAMPSMDSASNVFAAVGQHGAICFSPFAIEDFAGRKDGIAEAHATGEYLARSYSLLQSMSARILAAQGTGKMRGFAQNEEPGANFSFSGFDVQITFAERKAGMPKAGGLILQTGGADFILAGLGFKAEFLPPAGAPGKIDYLYIEEGVFRGGEWQAGRRLNGDEYQLSFAEDAKILRCGVYRYE